LKEKLNKDEKWKVVPIKEYNSYKISNHGRIKNSKDKILNPYNISGYKVIQLSSDGKTKNLKMHRLVAMAFIPNPNNYSIVNHIDENKVNNHISNLEWVTSSQNIKHSIKESRLEANGKKVQQISIDGKFIKEWSYIAKAGKELGISAKTISSVCRGIGQTAGGYKWKFIDK
jgi:hypothetical protein